MRENVRNGAPPDYSTRTIDRLEKTARVIRGFAVAWGTLTVVTFGFIAVGLITSEELDPARPLFIFATALCAFFLFTLSWPIKADLRHGLLRVLLVLRWQAAAGVTIAFTLGFVARPELRMAFWLFGSYLTASAVFLMLISLVDIGLRRRYAAMDKLARESELRVAFREAASTEMQLSGSRRELKLATLVVLAWIACAVSQMSANRTLR